MRISDWSSDVCSYDLFVPRQPGHKALINLELLDGQAFESQQRRITGTEVIDSQSHPQLPQTMHLLQRHLRVIHHRSEEHTSELQSLMRISYAVYCLKKKRQVTVSRKPTDREADPRNKRAEHGD